MPRPPTKLHLENLSRAELRWNEDGTIDELILYDHSGRMSLHLEQMDDGEFWVGMRAHGGADVHLSITKQCTATVCGEAVKMRKDW